MVTDPQTSGGLLVACTPDVVGEVLEAFRAEGIEIPFPQRDVRLIPPDAR